MNKFHRQVFIVSYLLNNFVHVIRTNKENLFSINESQINFEKRKSSGQKLWLKSVNLNQKKHKVPLR